MLSEVYLGLGSNLGDRRYVIDQALRQLQELSTGLKVSSLYETAPKGFRDQPVFLNAACRIWTTLDPFELLKELNGIQDAFGGRRAFVNGPRMLDIDVLLFGRLTLSTPTLTIPHPRMAERMFVLVPLEEIASGFQHPVLKQTIRELTLCLWTSMGDCGAVTLQSVRVDG